MTHQLSRFFTLREMCKSTIALNMGINNLLLPGRYGDDDKILNLELLCVHVMDKVREHFGQPIRPTSGYRNRIVNTLAGGAWRSQHLVGEACDFEIAGIDNKAVAEWIRDNLTFDQLVLEHYDRHIKNSGWVHVSFTGRRDNRGMVLRKVKGQKGYIKGLEI